MTPGIPVPRCWHSESIEARRRTERDSNRRLLLLQTIPARILVRNAFAHELPGFLEYRVKIQLPLDGRETLRVNCHTHDRDSRNPIPYGLQDPSTWLTWSASLGDTRSAARGYSADGETDG